MNEEKAPERKDSGRKGVRKLLRTDVYRDAARPPEPASLPPAEPAAAPSPEPAPAPAPVLGTPEQAPEQAPAPAPTPGPAPAPLLAPPPEPVPAPARAPAPAPGPAVISAAAAPAPAPAAAAAAPPAQASAPAEKAPPKKLTTKFLKAVGGLIVPNTPGGSPDEPPGHTPTPGLLEEDPLSSERFKTRTKKLLSKRLERSAITKYPASLAPVIRVTQLDAFYEQQQVLFGLDFAVRRGEILAILGGSGSGKTTLLKHMIGLLRPRGGKIEIGGQDIARLEGDDLALVLKSIGMLFQYSALFNSVTVGENVALPLREYTDLPEGAIQAIVRLKLSLVGLPGIENRMPSELSGGMKKRAALARAVALDPDSVFFDEPASGLDPIAAAELDALILHLNRSFGTTMVIVTHDLENAFNVAHRILMLDRGRVVAVGSPAQIQASEDPWVRSFIARKSAARDAIDESFFSRLESRDANLWDTKERKVED